MENKTICGAKTKKDGSPCQRAPCDGRERCHLHGGAQPRGPDHPNYKHGLYSKYAGASLGEVLKQLEEVSIDELVRPDGEIRLLLALLLNAKALQDEEPDLDGLDTFTKIIDRITMVKRRSLDIMADQERLIPATDIQLFLSWIEEQLIEHVGKSATYDIIDNLEEFKLSDSCE